MQKLERVLNAATRFYTENYHSRYKLNVTTYTTMHNLGTERTSGQENKSQSPVSDKQMTDCDMVRKANKSSVVCKGSQLPASPNISEQKRYLQVPVFPCNY